MIEEVNEKDICECVNVIRVSFATVADEFGFTAENAPKFTAFATTEERLKWHLFGEHRRMYAFWDNGKIVGYYSSSMLKSLSLPLYGRAKTIASLYRSGSICPIFHAVQ